LTGRPGTGASRHDPQARLASGNSAPGKARTTTVSSKPADDLQLADDKAGGIRQRGRVGAGGFAPYSSDAGFEKPPSWERIDRD
jgi:hypothetical protein